MAARDGRSELEMGIDRELENREGRDALRYDR